MKHQVPFSLKNNEKIFMNVFCCSRDWRFKGLELIEHEIYVKGINKCQGCKLEQMMYFLVFLGLLSSS